ncbi:MAG TPA: transcription antiterminator [Tepidimicrobium sp.]|nr:transcription antiterminator [Tepidimicrobium sp.]
MAQGFNVTERTIRYDLEEINSFFIKKRISIHIVIRDGIITIESNIYRRFDAIRRIKEMSLGLCDYIPSVDERKYIILLELLFSNDFITIEYLSKKICISSNTIKNDLNKVKDWLIKAGINPQFIPGKGLYVEGKERLIRKTAIKVFREALSLEQYIGLIQKEVYGHTNNYIGIMFNHIFEYSNVKKMRYCMDILQKKFNAIFSDYTYSDLTIFLSILLKRIHLGYNISIPEEDKAEIHKTDVYRKVDSISKFIFKYFDTELIDDELIYISQYILSSNIPIPPTIYNYPYLLEDHAFITDLIGEVSRNCNIDLTRNSKLYNSLSTFGLAFYYRQKYQVEVYNPYIEQIKRHYPRLFEVVKSSVLLLKPDIWTTINDSEIGLIVLYFAAALEEPQNKLKVIVLCETGFPIGNLLATRLKLIFNIEVVDIECISQGKKALSKHKVDFIIATSPFTCRNIPYVVVSPLLTGEDIASIRKLMETLSHGCRKLIL